MAFLSLDVEIEYNFSLIAISSNQKSHSLCWAINKDLDSRLTLDSNYVVRSKSHVTEFRKYRSEVDGFSFVLLCIFKSAIYTTFYRIQTLWNGQ